MFKTICDLWCDLMHNQLTWPIHGQYFCRRCRRRFAVPWEGVGSVACNQQWPDETRAGASMARRILGGVREFAKFDKGILWNSGRGNQIPKEYLK